jgi:uncharacterized repeat protein (TIGR04138 family)
MPQKESEPKKTIRQIAEDAGLYPPEAYEFVQAGLQYTVDKLHGDGRGTGRHVSGRELSEGLREFALMQWGMLARVVLRRWGITRTDDFGRIVFAMVECGWMSKTDDDTMEDFRGIFDFASTFEDGYRIECKS